MRWGIVIILIVLFNYLAAKGLHNSGLVSNLTNGSMISLIALAVYTLLLAIPYTPGMEIGVSLLVMQGSAVAPFVYAATVLGLSLSYALGYAFATKLPCTFLRYLGLIRAYEFIEDMRAMDHHERLQRITRAVPPWFGTWIIGYRYILLAILVNMPGNSLIGGGGGILLIAGMSRLFSYPLVLATLLLATAPVPLAVWLLGVDILK